MEVLISIGVVFIGLMGAAALFPVAGYQLQSGNTHERAALMGSKAFREFQIYAMHDTANWVKRNLQDNGAPAPVIDFHRAYCIDPQGVAHGVGNVASPLLTPTLRPKLYYSGNMFPTPEIINEAEYPQRDPTIYEGYIVMARISVNSIPGHRFFAASLADGAFVMDDDLEFAIPDSSTLSPVQMMLNSVSGNPTPLKRISKGEFSWFAIVAPKLQTENHLNPIGGDSPTLQVRVETPVADLWIVVTRQRDLNQWDPEDPASAGESVAVVNLLGGGEFEIIGHPGDETSAVNKMRTGEWVMLRHVSEFDFSPLLYGEEEIPPFYEQIGWYRVLSADEEFHDPPPGFGAERQARYVTLAGPDFSPVNAAPMFPTQAIHVDGVVGVYRKTIRIEFE